METLKDFGRAFLFVNLLLAMLMMASCKLQPEAEPVAVIRDAQGNTLLVDCIRKTAPEAIGNCAVSAGGNVNGVRASHNSSSSVSSDSRYYYWRIFSFQERLLCQYLFPGYALQACFYLFGYNRPNPQPPEDGWCHLDDFNFFGWPRHCGGEEDPFAGKLLSVRKEQIVFDTDPGDGNTNRPETSELYVNESGAIYSRYCPESVEGPAVLPTPCTQDFVHQLRRRTLRQIHYYLDRVTGGLVDESGPINCLAVSTHKFLYDGRNGQIQLRDMGDPCGADYVNQSQAGQILVDFLVRVKDHFGLPMAP